VQRTQTLSESGKFEVALSQQYTFENPFHLKDLLCFHCCLTAAKSKCTVTETQGDGPSVLSLWFPNNSSNE
jgi:hypothetical protein